MGHSILGFRTYNTPAMAGAGRHAAGLSRPANALHREGWPAVKDLLADEPPGAGWPARQDFQATGWSAGADLGPADISPFEPGAKPELDDHGNQIGPLRKRKAPGVKRIELALMAADRVMREELQKPRRGQAPCKSVELMCAGPPPWDAPEAWPLERVLEWARATLEFVRLALPDARIAAASLHLDERSPHLHITVAPMARDAKGRLRLGACAVRRALAAMAPRREARLKGSYRDELSRAAAAYAHHVGTRFGLEAGQVASTAQHVPVDPVKGAELRALDNERRAEEAQREEDRARNATEGERRECARLERQKAEGFRRLDEIREAQANAEAPHVARLGVLLDATLRLQQRHSNLQNDVVERERAASAAVEAQQKADRLAARAKTVIRRFFRAAERMVGRLRTEIAGLVSQRSELNQSIESSRSEAKTAAETLQSLARQVRESKLVADQAIKPHQDRVQRSKEKADAAVEADETRTSSAEGVRAAAEAAANDASASRDLLQEQVSQLTETRDRLQAQIEDDRALGASLVSRRGRGIRQELEGERDAAVQQAKDAAAGQARMQDLTGQWQRYGEGQRASAEAEHQSALELAEQVDDLKRQLRVQGILDEVRAMDSEAESVRRRREKARENAPVSVPGVAPAVRAPERPRPGIGS